MLKEPKEKSSDLKIKERDKLMNFRKHRLSSLSLICSTVDNNTVSQLHTVTLQHLKAFSWWNPS